MDRALSCVWWKPSKKGICWFVGAGQGIAQQLASNTSAEWRTIDLFACSIISWVNLYIIYTTVGANSANYSNNSS